MKQTTVLAPVIDLKRGGSADERQIIDTPPHAAPGLKVGFQCLDNFLSSALLNHKQLYSAENIFRQHSLSPETSILITTF